MIQSLIYLRKYQFILAITMFLLGTVSAQNQDSEHIAADYDRISVSYLTMNYSSQKLPGAFLEEFSKMTFAHKYFYNDLGYKVINTNLPKIKQLNAYEQFERTDKKLGDFKNYFTNLFKEEKRIFLNPTDTLGQRILRELMKEKGGSEIMGIWSAQDEKGNFSTLLERAKYNLSANELKRIVDYKKLQSFRQLFFQNYILVFDFDEVITWRQYCKKNNIERKEEEIPEGVVTDFAVYIFKLSIDKPIFNDHIKPNFKNTQALLNYDYPFEYVAKFQLQASSGRSDYNNKATRQQKWIKNDFWKETKKDYNNIPDNQGNDYAALAQDAFEKVGYLIEARLENFKVRTPLVEKADKAIWAEIGKKESLSAEQRYFVYEYRMGKDKVVYSKRKGVLRATRQIADNRESLVNKDGSYKRSKFRQIHGGKLDEGMFLVQHNDRGFSIAAGYAQRNSSNFQMRLDYNLTRVATFLPEGTKLFIEFAFGNTELDISTNHFGYGASKSLLLNRWIDLEPFIGYYGQSFDGNDDVSQNYWNLGVRAPITLRYNLFLVPEISLTSQDAIFGTDADRLNYGLLLRADF